MKYRNYLRYPVSVAIVVVCTCIASGECVAEKFAINQSGKITLGNVSFDGLEEYVQSDYFRETGKRCGTRRAEGVQQQKLEKSQSDCTISLTSIKDEYWSAVVYTVPVWWHVIYRSDGEGNISDATIEAQMDVLNDDYRAKAGTLGSQGYDTKIQFELAGITRTQNTTWFNDLDESGYKQALMKDPAKYLNIYTNTAGGNLGYAYYPQDWAGHWRDGIVMLYQAVGGRDNGFFTYDQGRTLVHEMGHYLGLAHTFDGETCNNTYSTGDLVVDTNSENVEHYGCSQTYTCGTADPIHNYMDYTDDTCMYQFTSEQANRAVCGLVNYRPSAYQTDVAVSPYLAPLLLRK